MKILREIDNTEREQESLEHKCLRKKCVCFLRKKMRNKIKTFEDYQIMLKQIMQFVEDQVLIYGNTSLQCSFHSKKKKFAKVLKEGGAGGIQGETRGPGSPLKFNP